MGIVCRHTCGAQTPTMLSPNSSLTGVMRITASTANPFLSLRCHRHAARDGHPALPKDIAGHATLLPETLLPYAVFFPMQEEDISSRNNLLLHERVRLHLLITQIGIHHWLWSVKDMINQS